MKQINNTLYIEFAEMVEAGVKESTLKIASHRNSASWDIIDDPADKRKVLFGYKRLKDVYKKAIIDRFGDPYEYMAQQPIKDMVEPDYKAEEYFRNYRYDSNKCLPYEHQERYTVAASWLEMLKKVNADPTIIKKGLNLKLDKFYGLVCDIIKTNNIELPSSYQRLINKRKEYELKGYDSLIDWRFGNKNTAKIGKSDSGFDAELFKKQTAVILKIADMHNNFDAAQVTRFANVIYQKQGWQTVSESTVRNMLAQNKPQVTAGAKGVRVYNSHIAMQVKRKRPDFPLQYFTLDGWTVELLYQGQNKNGQWTYDNRLVVVIVLDAMNNYPVGYAIGDRENTDLIKDANRNAILHIHQLFGEPYRPWQIQSDHYGIKTLTPFYQAVGKLYTPAAVGNAKSKVIEPYFKYLNKEYCQRFPNWSGFNVTARKENQVNAEYLDKIKTNFPTKEEVVKTIHLIIQQERKIKAEEYVQKFSALPEKDKATLSQADMLMIFGQEHKYLNSINGKGLITTLAGKELVYDSFDPTFRANQHLKWRIIYDENNLDTVLAVSEDNKLKFLLEQKRAIPMDIRSATAEDFQYLSQINQFNKQRKEEIIQNRIENNNVVNEIISSTPLQLDDHNEAMLKLMFTHNGQQKERLQDAKKLHNVRKKEAKRIEKITSQEHEQMKSEHLEFIMDNHNFNQYLD